MNSNQEHVGFDRVFISVGSSAQNKILETILPFYEERYGKVFSVIADGPNGDRIGSGGALLKTLQQTDAEGNGRTLLIPAGGYGKRAPNYSLPGKMLVPVGANDATHVPAVLDAILDNAFRLSDKIGAGLVVCCGDIIVDMSGLSETLHQSAAFCVFSGIGTGTRHGVMFPDQTGLLRDYAQKESADRLRRLAQAYVYGEEIPVDAGWLYLSSSYLNALNRIRGVLSDFIEASGRELSLFSDILPVNAVNTDRAAFIQSENGDLRSFIWDALHGEPLYVHCLRQPFLHFGTPVEILENNRYLSKTEETRLYNSDMAPSAAVGDGCLMENVRLTGNCRIGSGCLITDIDLQDVCIPAHTSVFGLRLKNGRFVCCAQRIESDPSVAGETMRKNWSEPLYYPATSFSASYKLFLESDKRERKISLQSALRMADAQYYLDWRQYLADTLRCGTPLPAYHEYRAQVIQAHFKSNAPCKSLRCVKERVDIHLPVRVNFSGTWTDCMPYCIENGGEVINAAVKVNGRYPISVTAEAIGERRIEMRSADDSRGVEVYSDDTVDFALSPCNLHRAVFRALGVDKNTAIETGVRLTVRVDGLMKGSGLGTSSILLYGCFLALNRLLGLCLTEKELLQYVFVAEQLMHTGGGWQDQGAMIGGGLKCVRSAPGLPQTLDIEPLPCGDAFLKTLSDRLVLVPTGQRHFGRFIVMDVMDRYLSRQPQTLRAFEALRELNGRMREAVADEDPAAFGACMNLHAKHLDLLSPLIYNNIIKSISEKCAPFADGCSICGAGGGGYLAVLLKKGVSPQHLCETLHVFAPPMEIL